MKTVFITWWASWLGKEIARQLIAKWDEVILLDKDIEKLQQTGAELWISSYICCDISQKSEIIKLKDTIAALHVEIDVLVNNAGIWTDNELDELHPQNQIAVMQVNALWNMWISDIFIPYFKKKWRWYLLNVLSVSALDNHPAWDNSLWKYYWASKWALNGYIKSIKKECGESKIKVSALYPGWFESNFYENAWKIDAHNQPWMMPVWTVASSVVFMINMPSDVVIDELVITKF